VIILAFCELFYNNKPYGSVYWEKKDLSPVHRTLSKNRKCARKSLVYETENPDLRLPWGVMQPEGNEFFAQRSFTKNKLAEYGVELDKLNAAEITTALFNRPETTRSIKKIPDKGWQRIKPGKEITSDPVLYASIMEADEILIKKTKSYNYIAVLLSAIYLIISAVFFPFQQLRKSAKSFMNLAIGREGMPKCVNIEELFG
jgi:hypothetical protein